MRVFSSRISHTPKYRGERVTKIWGYDPKWEITRVIGFSINFKNRNSWKFVWNTRAGRHHIETLDKQLRNVSR